MTSLRAVCRQRFPIHRSGKSLACTVHCRAVKKGIKPRPVKNGFHLSPASCFFYCLRAGVWNERSWGTPDYIAGLRSTLNAAGFDKTQIVLPDGGSEEIDRALKSTAGNPAFAQAFSTIGMHYPCNAPNPDVNAQGYAYWSSEDYSTVADWAGAGCWGRSLVQNYVRMNQTATIAWSLIWSVYAQLPYFGNGLMYAYSPWSGYYEVNQAIWTTVRYSSHIPDLARRKEALTVASSISCIFFGLQHSKPSFCGDVHCALPFKTHSSSLLAS